MSSWDYCFVNLGDWPVPSPRLRVKGHLRIQIAHSSRFYSISISTPISMSISFAVAIAFFLGLCARAIYENGDEDGDGDGDGERARTWRERNNKWHPRTFRTVPFNQPVCAFGELFQKQPQQNCKANIMMICEPIPIAISLCVLLRSAHAACQITNEKLFPPTLVYMRADKRRSADDVSASALCRRLCCCWSFFFFIIIIRLVNDRVSLY